MALKLNSSIQVAKAGTVDYGNMRVDGLKVFRSYAHLFPLRMNPVNLSFYQPSQLHPFVILPLIIVSSFILHVSSFD